jgi:hypothetical protein
MFQGQGNLQTTLQRVSFQKVKQQWQRVLQAINMPKQPWDYGVVWECELMQRTTSPPYHSNGTTPIEIITGSTPDISEYLDIGSITGYSATFYHSNGSTPTEIITDDTPDFFE